MTKKSDLPLPGQTPHGMELLAQLLSSNPETAFDYLELRGLLGGEAAAYAAERATDEEIAGLRRRLDAVEAAHGGTDLAHEALVDNQFHLAIYEAAHNEVIAHVMRAVFELLNSGVFYDRTALCARSGVRDTFLRQHQAIYAAIAARDPVSARAAAKAHLDSAAEALRESLTADRRREVSARRAEGADLTVHKSRP